MLPKHYRQQQVSSSITPLSLHSIIALHRIKSASLSLSPKTRQSFPLWWTIRRNLHTHTQSLTQHNSPLLLATKGHASRVARSGKKRTSRAARLMPRAIPSLSLSLLLLRSGVIRLLYARAAVASQSVMRFSRSPGVAYSALRLHTRTHMRNFFSSSRL